MSEWLKHWHFLSFPFSPHFSAIGPTLVNLPRGPLPQSCPLPVHHSQNFQNDPSRRGESILKMDWLMSVGLGRWEKATTLFFKKIKQYKTLTS